MRTNTLNFVTGLLSTEYNTLEENAKTMGEAIASVTTVEITRAVRSTKINNLTIKDGQAIGIVNDNDIVAAGDIVSEVLLSALDKVGIESAEVVTIYRGADAGESETEKVIQKLQNSYPSKQVELVNGGQPHYNYIISLE